MVLGLLASAPRARAQVRTTPEEPPLEGLFGTGGRTTMGLTLLTYGGFDQSTIRTIAPDLDLSRVSDGDYVGATAGLTVARPAGRWNIAANGTSDIHYYPKQGGLTGLTAQTSAASLSLGRPVKRHGAVRLSQVFSDASFYEFNPFAAFTVSNPEDLALPTSDFRIQRGQTYRYDLSAGTDWQLTRRDQVGVTYGFGYAAFPVEDLRLLTHSGDVRLTHRATRTLSVVAGYGFEQVTSPQAPTARFQRLDSGLQYSATLFDRKTRVSASGGAAVASARDPVSGRLSQVLEAIVNASLRHEVTRSWGVALEYRREPLVLELYTEPVYADSVFLTLNGRPARRVTLATTAGYSRSVLNIGLGDRANQTYFGVARAGWSITRLLSAYGEYAYYGFETAPNRFSIAPSARVGRHSIRAGASWSVPLLIPRAGR